MQAAQLSRTRAFTDLLAAHHELTSLEWLEFRQTVVGAIGWSVVALLSAMTSWLGLNVVLVVVLHEQPLIAVGAIVALNALVCALGGYQIKRRLSRPFFALSKREIKIDARSILRALP